MGAPIAPLELESNLESTEDGPTLELEEVLHLINDFKLPDILFILSLNAEGLEDLPTVWTDAPNDVRHVVVFVQRGYNGVEFDTNAEFMQEVSHRKASTKVS